MRKLIPTAMAVVALAIPAAASASGEVPEQASCEGATHGAFADVNGNFGWLGEDGGTPGHYGAVGQEPGATGYRNSHVEC
jgi:hypothetical protein